MIRESTNTQQANDKRLRIFVDAHSFDQEFQGSRTFIKGVYAELSKRKDILLILAAYDIENLKKHFPVSDNICLIKYRSRSRLIRLIYDVPSLIKKHKVDFAHFQYISPLVKNCKHILTIHDMLFVEYPEEFPRMYRFLRKLLFKRSARKADILTTVSDYSQKMIKQYLGIDLQRIAIVPNGVGSRFFETYQKSDAQQLMAVKYGISKYILYVSRIEPRKNHLLLCKAYLELKLYQKGYYLVFLGHQSIRVTELDDFLNSLGTDLRQFIIFQPEVDDEWLLKFYRGADIFIYPSKAEGFGIPPLEAAASKIPVICSNTSAMKDFSFFGRNHIDPCDFEALKDRMSSIITEECNKQNLQDLSELIRENYCWKKAAEKLYGLFTNN